MEGAPPREHEKERKEGAPPKEKERKEKEGAPPKEKERKEGVLPKEKEKERRERTVAAKATTTMTVREKATYALVSSLEHVMRGSAPEVVITQNQFS